MGKSTFINVGDTFHCGLWLFIFYYWLNISRLEDFVMSVSCAWAFALACWCVGGDKKGLGWGHDINQK